MIHKDIKAIKQYAQQIGACRLVESITSYQTLALALLSPQGVEFLAHHQEQATLDLFREHKTKLAQYSINVDSQRTLRPKAASCMFVGPSTKAVAIPSGTSQIYTYVVMDGALLTVRASNYAVVRIYNLGGHINIHNDGTAKILQ